MSLLHAAAVGLQDFGVLLCGPSGAGKSTLAALCILRGLDFVADDKVSFDGAFANPVCKTITLGGAPDGLPASFLQKNWNRKKDILQLDFAPRRDLPVRAALCLSRCSIPEIIQTSPLAVIPRIIWDTVINLRNAAISDAPQFWDILKHLDFYNFNLGPDVGTNADVLCKFIKEKSCIS